MKLLLRNLFIASLFLSPAGYCFGQKISFCDTANLWVTTGDVNAACAWERRAYLGKDTLISGQTYKKLNYLSLIYTSYSSGCNAIVANGFFVREDAAYGMVYYRQPTVDQYEHVLYNYNMQPGDTIQYVHNVWGGGSVADSLVRLDSALIGGVYHKTFDFQSVTGRGNRAYTVIEGVGCVNHPFYPAYAGNCQGYTERLRCFSQSGLVQDFSMRWNQCDQLGNNFYTNCDYSSATTRVAVTEVAKLSVVPNPARDRFEVNVGADAKACTLTVHDLLGREMTNAVIKGTTHTVGTQSWMAGTYFVTVSGADGFSARQMVVVGR